MFAKFDVNGDKTITYEEFYRALCKGVTGKDSKYDPVREKATKISNELKRVIKQYNLDVLAIMNNFDKSGKGKLDEIELAKLIPVIGKDA